MDTPEKKPKTPKQETELDDKSKKRSEEIAELLAKAKAFIMANEEDYGIAPVEAQACGTPVIAYGKAGVLETVVDGKTGVFFYEQSPEGLKKAVDRFAEIADSFDAETIRKQAEKFSVETFRNKFAEFVEEKVKERNSDSVNG